MPSDRKRPSYRARSRKRYRIKERLNLGGIYVESNGTTWQHIIDLTPSQMFAEQIVVSTLSNDGVLQRIYPDIDAALQAEV